MSEEPRDRRTRKIELEIEIDAPVEAVWSALTNGEELSSWFPPVASVEPGLGGSVTVSWGEEGDWTSEITIWEPNRHLQVSDAPWGDPPVLMAIDYTLTSEGGRTVLRLVQSGFSADADWDDQFHMTENGWAFFLWNLKHYLEQHPGTRRTMTSVRPAVSGTREEVWERLMGPSGLGLETGPGRGGRFTLRIGDEELHGETILVDRPWAFAGMVENLDRGAVHIELEGSGPRWNLGVWISTYGVPDERMSAVKGALDDVVSPLVSPDE